MLTINFVKQAMALIEFSFYVIDHVPEKSSVSLPVFELSEISLF